MATSLLLTCYFQHNMVKTVKMSHPYHTMERPMDGSTSPHFHFSQIWVFQLKVPTEQAALKILSGFQQGGVRLTWCWHESIGLQMLIVGRGFTYRPFKAETLHWPDSCWQTTMWCKIKYKRNKPWRQMTLEEAFFCSNKIFPFIFSPKCHIDL